MKKLFIVLVLGTFIACNSGTTAEDVKDSTVEAIDSANEVKTDAMDSTTEAKIDSLKK